jgi:hypothetical protein
MTDENIAFDVEATGLSGNVPDIPNERRLIWRNLIRFSLK